MQREIFDLLSFFLSFFFDERLLTFLSLSLSLSNTTKTTEMSYSTQTRKLVVAGLGNYTHPLTKHSVSSTFSFSSLFCGNLTGLSLIQIGQLLLENLAIKASSLTGSIGSSSLILNKKTSIYSTKIIIPSTSNSLLPITNSQGINLPSLELNFIKSHQLMNISGTSLHSISKNFLNVNELNFQFRLITLQDDLDLFSQNFKLQKSGSNRGHNGIRSLERSLNHKSFYRIRLGIGRGLKGEAVSDWVMSPLTRDEVRSVEVGGVVLEGVWKLLMDVGWRDEVV